MRRSGLSPDGLCLGGLRPGGLSSGGLSAGGLSAGGLSPGGLGPGGFSPSVLSPQNFCFYRNEASVDATLLTPAKNYHLHGGRCRTTFVLSMPRHHWRLQG